MCWARGANVECVHVVKRQRALTHGAQHGVLVSVKGVGGVSRRCVVVMGKMAVWWGSRVVETVVDVGLELGHWHHLAADKARLHCVCVTCMCRRIVRSMHGEREKIKTSTLGFCNLLLLPWLLGETTFTEGFPKE